MTERDSGGGGMTGATGDLTPDEIQRDFEPAELREVSDPLHRADVTQAQPSHGAGQEERDPRVGSDERTDHEEHF